jgi:plasmid replication initiation protein
MAKKRIKDDAKSVPAEKHALVTRKKEVVKSSAAIHSSNTISLLERKVWNCLLAHAYDSLMEREIHAIPVKELVNLLNFTSNNYDYLKSSLETLIGTVVSWNILRKDDTEWAATSLLSSATIKKSVVYYSYSPVLRQKLFNPAMYARISFSLQNRFSSKYALALYELCVDYYDVKRNEGETPFIGIEQFRELMGIEPNEYLEFKRLSKRVIYDPIEEIVNYSDFIIEPIFKREKRRVVAIKLLIRSKESVMTKDISMPPLLPSSLPQKADVVMHSEDTSLHVQEEPIVQIDKRYFILNQEDREKIEELAVEYMPRFFRLYFLSDKEEYVELRKPLLPIYNQKINQLIEEFFDDNAEEYDNE